MLGLDRQHAAAATGDNLRAIPADEYPIDADAPAPTPVEPRPVERKGQRLEFGIGGPGSSDLRSRGRG